MNEDVAASGNKDPVPSTSSQTEEATQGDSELPSKEALKTGEGAEENYRFVQASVFHCSVWPWQKVCNSDHQPMFRVSSVPVCYQVR